VLNSMLSVSNLCCRSCTHAPHAAGRTHGRSRLQTGQFVCRVSMLTKCGVCVCMRVCACMCVYAFCKDGVCGRGWCARAIRYVTGNFIPCRRHTY